MTVKSVEEALEISGEVEYYKRCDYVFEGGNLDGQILCWGWKGGPTRQFLQIVRKEEKLIHEVEKGMREKSNLMLIFFPFLIVQIDVDVRVEGDPLVFLVGVADKVIEVAEGGPIDEDVSELVDVVDELLIDCVFGDDGFGDGEFI